MRNKSRHVGSAASEDIAIQALSFLASEPERLGRFLSITGLGPANLRGAAHDPRFLAQILDYLASDEALLLTFSLHAQIGPLRIAQAHHHLAGQPQPGSV